MSGMKSGKLVSKTNGSLAEAVGCDQAVPDAAHRELVAATLGEDEGVLAIDGTDIPRTGTSRWGWRGRTVASGRACPLPGRLLRGLPRVRSRSLSGTAPLPKPGLGLGCEPYGTAANRGADGHALPHQVATGPGDADRLGGRGLAAGALGDLRRRLRLQLRFPGRCGRPGVGLPGRGAPHWTTRPTQSGARSLPVFSGPSQAVGTVANRLPLAAWQPFVLREGSKGSQAVFCAVLRVTAHRDREPDLDVWLVLRRRPDADQA